jgi:hypothetical protein
VIDVVVAVLAIGVAAVWTALAVAAGEGERRGQVAKRRQRRVPPSDHRPISVPFGHSRVGRSHTGYRFPEYPTRA